MAGLYSDPIGDVIITTMVIPASVRGFLCSIDSCVTPKVTRGWCSKHYQRWKRNGDPMKLTVMPNHTMLVCGLGDCTKKYYAKGFCSTHYYSWRQYGDPYERRQGEYGAGHTGKDGYRHVFRPDHQNAYSNGNVREHVFVMSTVLGRALLPGENVHHLNGVKDDNRPENLELWLTHQPKGQRVTDLLEWAEEIIRRYAQ